MKTNTVEMIKQDLLDQLERNGTQGKYFEDLVADYVKMLEIKNKLIADIDKRGAVVLHTTDKGTQNYKKNESVGDLIKLNDRMTKLLGFLGIEPGQVMDPDDEM